jgi:hypothetical protein
MMRLPLRLTRDLSKVLLAQKLFGADRRPLAARVELPSVPEDLSDSGPTPNEVPDVSSLLSDNNAPVVWIGVTSTSHPRVGQIAREFMARKKTVFLEIDGAALRRRIHEFRPVANLFLVLPLHCLQSAHDLRAGSSGNFRTTLESIRTARLSGFHLCVQTSIFADTANEELRELSELVPKLGADGWLVRRADSASVAEVPAEKVAAARNLISNARWRTFSEQLERSLAQHAPLLSEAAAQSRASRDLAQREEGLGTL